jgi:nucleotide-binding universal stress UspA family protein
MSGPDTSQAGPPARHDTAPPSAQGSAAGLHGPEPASGANAPGSPRTASDTAEAPTAPQTPTILAATDFTPRSARVAGRAAALAQVMGARLVLVHVLPARPTGPVQAATGQRVRPLLARLGLAGRAITREAAQARLLTLSQSLPVPAETRLLEGPVGEALALAAAETGATLLVLGLHRERRVLDVLRLTSMEKIVLASPVPVLIAHQPGARPYARVLALTDFSPGSAAALTMAARIAPDASFHAVHALQVPLVAAVAGGDAAHDTALTRAELMRTAFLALPGLPPFQEPPELVPGGVHEVLDYRRRELGADLVCIGTHSGSDPDALGHYSRDLMRAPPSDLLVAKPA